MNEDILDYATETVSEPVITEAPAKEQIEEQVQDKPANEEINENEGQKDDAQRDVEFPKKAVNAILRRDKQIGRMRAETAALKAEIQALKERANKPTDGKPSEDDFDNYGDYIRAVANFEAEQKIARTTKEQQQQLETQQREAWFKQREQHVVSQAQELMQKLPGVEQFITEYRDVLSDLPPYLEQVSYEMENSPLAFYTLAREGTLRDILDMSPAQAIMELGRAEMRGKDLFNKPVTSAPAPLKHSLRGAGASQKPLSQMTADEIVKWANS